MGWRSSSIWPVTPSPPCATASWPARRLQLGSVRLVIARCSVDYAGRLSAHLPMATRLLIVKADSSVLVHSDGGTAHSVVRRQVVDYMRSNSAMFAEFLTVPVETHLARICTKLGVSGRAAVAAAIERTRTAASTPE